jgi:hypothetical protein
VSALPANQFMASPSGASGFLSPRAIVITDLPALAFSNLTGNIAVSQMNGGTGASASTFWRGDGTWQTPAGGGNVSNSGTPTNGQAALWTSATTIQGTSALPVTVFNSGTGASISTFWRGDGTWATPAGAGTVTSVGQTFTGGLISVAGSPITGAGTLALTVAGTSGGVPYFSAANTWASSAALTANLPVIGGGAGVAPSVGTRSGNTTQFVTTTGAQTSGDCVKIDASGNHIANGSACGGGGALTYTSSAGTTTALTTDTAANMASVSLAAGDWQCWGGVGFTVSSSASRFKVATSTTTTAFPASPAGGQVELVTSPATLITGTVQAGVERYNLGATTTVYLVALASFGAGTVDGKGTIQCRKLG